jgi:hypothetical protein
MSQDTIRAFLPRFIHAVTFAALAVALALPAKAQTTWNITVNIPSSGGTKLTYTVSCTPAPCPNTNAAAITVALGDSVYWITDQHAEMWIVHEDAILDKNNSNTATHLHHVKNGQSDGGKTDGVNAKKNSSHKYYVFLYDNRTLYYDDPRILIGGVDAALDKNIERIERQVRDLNVKGQKAMDLVSDIISKLEDLKKASKPE